MSKTMNRAQRRALARETGRRDLRLRKGLVAVGAVAALGTGIIAAPGMAMADSAPSAAVAGLDFAAILDVLDNPMVGQFVEGCRTGSLASGPDATKSTEFDPANPPLAVADCSGSNGTGIALVLPESIEVGQAAESMTMDLGKDINLLLVKYRMGERNLLEVLGGVVLGSGTVKSLAQAAVGIPVDPGAFDKYSRYDDIARDAALPVVMERYCDGVIVFNRCVGTWRDRDKNLAKRSEALKMAEYLTGHKYDHSKPVTLPAPVKPIGKSVIAGDGINVALSMRGGTALATTRNALALALAGADQGRTSTATAEYGVAIGANMDTSDITFTWFGQKLDFTKLRESGLLTSDLAGEAGAEASGMLDVVDGLNGNLPSIKEVACFGLNTTATAEGLGSCTNILGTIDIYKDLRPVTDGGSRQTQYGITDVTSLFMGNDALLKQLGPALGGDTAGIMDSPFMADMLKALLSEDDRIKFAKDFVRYTQNVTTDFAKEQVFEADGVTPKLDGDGNPIFQVKTTPRMVGVTHLVDEEYQVPVLVQDQDGDGVLLWVDHKGNPVAADTAGALPKMVAKLDADGKPVTETKTRKVAVPTMVWVDAEGAEVAEGTEGAKQIQKTVQATDAKGAPIFDPVIAKTTTAHWLTSDYGLTEPVVVQWLGHEMVFFPAVAVNGASRPNYLSLPQIRKITDGAKTGALPKVSLVQVANPFGLGTVSLYPFDPMRTITEYFKSVTIVDDVKGAVDLVQQLTGDKDKPEEQAPVEGDNPVEGETPSEGEQTLPSAALPPIVVNDTTGELPPIEVVEAPEAAAPAAAPTTEATVETPVEAVDVPGEAAISTAETEPVAAE